MAIEFRGACAMFQVFDMPTSLAFYCDILGFKVVGSSGRPPHCDWVLLRRGDVELMLNTQYEEEHRPPVADSARHGNHGDTSIYFGCADPDGAYEHLRNQRINARPAIVTDYGWKQVYVSDPDGYALCFHRPATPEEKTNAHASG